MAIRLGQNNYGKSRVRLLRVTRNNESGTVLKELTLALFPLKETSRRLTRKAITARCSRPTR